MATSLDALEALLQFREGAATKSFSPISNRPALPVPNPLDPKQPHLIEGDAPTPVVSRRPFGSGLKSAFSPKKLAPVGTSSVPNPLAADPIACQSPAQHRLPAPISAIKPLAPVSCSNSKIATHGFTVTPRAAAPIPTSSSHDAMSTHVLEVAIRSDKIRDALSSKPQRGKKRQNLNDLERLELTRTRNREHAKSTRSKKKQRLQELMDLEKNHLLLKEKEELDLLRKERLVTFVESVGHEHQAKHRLLFSKLIKLASEELLKPQFSVTNSVALSNENSGMVKVSIYGTDVESGNPKTLSGVICADFAPKTAELSSVSLYWSSQQSMPESVGMIPSVSMLSFES